MTKKDRRKQVVFYVDPAFSPPPGSLSSSIGEEERGDVLGVGLLFIFNIQPTVETQNYNTTCFEKLWTFSSEE